MKQILLILAWCLPMACNSQMQQDAKLIGKWKGLLKETGTGDPVEKIILEFTEDGKFIQYLGENKMQNKIEFTYRVRNNKLVTVENETKDETEGTYSVKNDTLTILYEGVENRYVKFK
ncbi:hypothetical protein [Sphingobacterium puteale]|uniref:hypothetical protein n=1 Tax=Sphingobacterium puteale TaxID=2420510 RepID=UPI003D98148B